MCPRGRAPLGAHPVLSAPVLSPSVLSPSVLIMVRCTRIADDTPIRAGSAP